MLDRCSIPEDFDLSNSEIKPLMFCMSMHWRFKVESVNLPGFGHSICLVSNFAAMLVKKVLMCAAASVGGMIDPSSFRRLISALLEPSLGRMSLTVFQKPLLFFLLFAKDLWRYEALASFIISLVSFFSRLAKAQSWSRFVLQALIMRSSL